MLNIKKNISIFISIFILLNTSMHAQEMKMHSYYQDYNYYGFPFYYNGGYRYRKNAITLAPYLGLGFDMMEGKPYVNLGILFREKNAFLDFKVVQDITPNIFRPIDKTAWTLLSTYGDFTFGYNINAVSLRSKTIVGNIAITNSYNNKGGIGNTNLALTLNIREIVSINASIYNDTINQINAHFNASFSILPKLDEYWYTLNFLIPMSFLHAYGWLELALLPSITYTDYFNESSKNIKIGNKSSLYTGRMASIIDYYQFTTSLEIEYRIYIKTPSPSLSRLFINIYGGVGYGKKFDETPDDGDLLYIYGGGIGYNLFDSVPLMLQAGSDHKRQLVLNLSFMSPITMKP